MQKEQDRTEEQGINDPRFETPVMTTSLNADTIPEGYQEYLQQGGDKFSEE